MADKAVLKSGSGALKPESKVMQDRPAGRYSTRAYAIRSKCLDCCGDSPKEVALCPCTQCPLWPYRFGTGTRARRIVAEEREARIPPDETHWAERIADYTGQAYYRREYGP